MDDGTVVDLATLIHYVARSRRRAAHPLHDLASGGVRRFSLIEAYANVPKLANQLHLAVQSGSDRILAAMKRGYTALEFKEKLRRLRAVRPSISVSTDIIVGFPGETDRDFEATLKLVREANFDQSFSFIYSQRPGTPAASLPDDVTPGSEAGAPRAAAGAAQRTGARHQRQMVGSTQRVLVARPSKKDARGTRGPHRKRPLGELRRAPRVSSAISSTWSSSRRARSRCAAVSSASCRRGMQRLAANQ